MTQSISWYRTSYPTGRLTAHDIAAFAKDSVVTPIEALGPRDFPDRVVTSDEHWFVDFFAPVGFCFSISYLLFSEWNLLVSIFSGRILLKFQYF